MSATSSVRGARVATARCWRRRQPRRPRRRVPTPAGAPARATRRGCHRATDGSPCGPARPHRRVAAAARSGRPRGMPSIPRWGLQDRVDQDSGSGRDPRQAPPADRVRTSFFVSAVALGAAALVHLLRYLLLVINRNTLLNWLVADAAALLSVLASLAAIAAVMTTRVSADPLVDRPSRRGVRACRAVGFPNAAGVVDRHAAAAVGRDGAGHRLCRGRGDYGALGQLGVDGGLRDVQLSAAAGVRLGAGLRRSSWPRPRTTTASCGRSSGAGG